MATRCTAQSKRRRDRCRYWAVPGMTVCRFHGGLTPRGPALPQFKTGRHSKFLPARLLARYQAAERDAELTTLRSELALTDARIADLLTRVDTGESGALWRQLRVIHKEFKRHRALQDVVKMTASLAELEHCLAQATTDHAAWNEIHELIDQRRKLAEAEHKRQMTLRQTITAEQATLMLGVIIDIIARHVQDKRVLNEIAIELQRLGHQEPPLGTEAEAADGGVVYLDRRRRVRGDLSS